MSVPKTTQDPKYLLYYMVEMYPRTHSFMWACVVWRTEPVHLGEPDRTHIDHIFIYKKVLLSYLERSVSETISLK